MDHFPPEVEALPVFEGAFSARQLHADNCEVLFASYPAGMDIPDHSHPSQNAGVITQGRLFMTMNGEEKSYGVGDWYRIAADCVHSARFEEASSLVEFWFAADVLDE